MFKCLATSKVDRALARSPAVAILGPRQVGKTTLARAAAAVRPESIYLDLETAADQAKLADPPRFFASRRGSLMVLDEVQNLAELFSELRAEIDADRRVGRFLLLGSASFQLLRQAQTLAGRLEVIDMAPLLLPEVTQRFEDIEQLWVRGGFPGSYTPLADEDSWQWRQDFIRHFLNVDLPTLGIGVDPPSMGRFWRMLAHLNGQLLNASVLSRSLGVSAPTVSRWLDHLVDALVVRRLEPWHANLGKRLVKSPKIYLRDTGLCMHCSEFVMLRPWPVIPHRAPLGKALWWNRSAPDYLQEHPPTSTVPRPAPSWTWLSSMKAGWSALRQSSRRRPL